MDSWLSYWASKIGKSNKSNNCAVEKGYSDKKCRDQIFHCSVDKRKKKAQE